MKINNYKKFLLSLLLGGSLTSCDQLQQLQGDGTTAPGSDLENLLNDETGFGEDKDAARETLRLLGAWESKCHKFHGQKAQNFDYLAGYQAEDAEEPATNNGKEQKYIKRYIAFELDPRFKDKLQEVKEEYKSEIADELKAEVTTFEDQPEDTAQLVDEATTPDSEKEVYDEVAKEGELDEVMNVSGDKPTV